MAYEVKTGAGQIAHFGILVLELLDVVLSELAQSERVRVADHLRGKNFGHSQQRDGSRIAPRALGRAPNAGTHLFEVPRQSRVVHAVKGCYDSVSHALPPLHGRVQRDAVGL